MLLFESNPAACRCAGVRKCTCCLCTQHGISTQVKFTVPLSVLQAYSCVQVAELASLAQLLPPCSPTVRNPPPDSSLCRAASPRLRPLQLLLPSPIAASASTAAPRLPPLPAAAPRLRPLQLLLAACVHFRCFSRSRPLRLLLPDCVRFNCCSPIASASTAAPRLRPLQLLLARLLPLQLLLPDCVHFNCCLPASTAAPRLHTSTACWIPPHAQVQCSRTFFAEFEVQ